MVATFVALRVGDVAPKGYAVDRATVRQKKTGRPVKFELTDQTRQAVDDFLKEAGKRPGEYLFTRHRGRDRAMTTRQYARLLTDWVASIGLDPRVFGPRTVGNKSRSPRSTPCLSRHIAGHKGIELFTTVFTTGAVNCLSVRRHQLAAIVLPLQRILGIVVAVSYPQGILATFVGIAALRRRHVVATAAYSMPP